MAELNPTEASLLGFLHRRPMTGFGVEFEKAALRWFTARPWAEEPSVDP